jgi:hypothetical protein
VIGALAILENAVLRIREVLLAGRVSDDSGKLLLAVGSGVGKLPTVRPSAFFKNAALKLRA